MRRSQASSGATLASLVALSLTASAAHAGGGAVALFDFGGPPRSARAGKYLAKRLRVVGVSELGKEGRTLMPRSKMLNALGLDGDLCVRSGACDPEVDKGLGVAHVVHGELAKEGDYRLSARLQDATSGEVLKSSEIRARAIDGLADRLPDVWRDLFGASAPRRDAPTPSSAPTAQARKPTTTASNAHGTVVVRGPLSTQGRGRMDSGQLATAVDRQMPQVHRCYGQQLEQDPSVAGGLALTIEISARGGVKAVTLQGDATGGSILAACLRTRARAWKLPKPWGGALTLSVPLELSPRLTADPEASTAGDDSDDSDELSLRQQFGTIDADAVERVVIGHVDQVQRCFVRGWKRDHSLKGGLTVKFRIALSGRVEKADIVDDELGSDKVSRCIRSRVLSWRFPRPSGGPAVVHYPFSFG